MRETRLAVIGLGLIGGSVLRGAVERSLAGDVVAWDKSPEALDAARRAGFGPHLAPDLEHACRDASVALVAVPVRGIPSLVDAARRLVASNGVVTDTGSTKRWITDEVSRLGASREGRSPAARRPFVGGHPIAGVEKSGFESSRPDLFEGQPWVLTIPRPHGLGTGDAGGAAGEAAARVSALAAGLGARPMVMSPEEHDRLLAVTSHLPYLLSLLVVHLGARAAGSQPALADFVAGGYRDATRLALQDPAMGTDILATNASELEPALRGLAALADDLLQRLSDTNPAAGGDSAHILAFAAEARALRLELGRLKRWP